MKNHNQNVGGGTLQEINKNILQKENPDNPIK